MNLNLPPNYINSNASTPIKPERIETNFYWNIPREATKMSLIPSEVLRALELISEEGRIRKDLSDKNPKEFKTPYNGTRKAIFLGIINLWKKNKAPDLLKNIVEIENISEFCRNNKIKGKDFYKEIKTFQNLVIAYCENDNHFIYKANLFTIFKSANNKKGIQITIDNTLKYILEKNKSFIYLPPELVKQERYIKYYLFRYDNFYSTDREKSKISIKNFAKKTDELLLMKKIGSTKYKKIVLENMQYVEEISLGHTTSKIEGDFLTLPNIRK
jgi:hypothetical protein